MKEINFTAPNYGGFSQRINQSLDGLSNGFGNIASGIGRAYDSYKADEENRRKWDEMLEEKRYQRERDRIEDERRAKEQEYIDSERRRMAEEREARYKGFRSAQDAARDYWSRGGESVDWDAEDRSLDDLHLGYETGNVDSAPGVQYGSGLNGARTRARNLVASGSDYDMIRSSSGQYTPGGFVGASNGNSEQANVGYDDISKYGAGAAMAYQMMMNASNPEDYYAAQNQLNSIINQHEAYAFQRGELDESRRESELLKAQSKHDDETLNGIAMHPTMTTLARLYNGMSDKKYSAMDIQSFMDNLDELQSQVYLIKDPYKRMEAQSRIDKAYGQYSALYGKKTAPGPRRN